MPMKDPTRQILVPLLEAEDVVEVHRIGDVGLFGRGVIMEERRSP